MSVKKIVNEELSISHLSCKADNWKKNNFGSREMKNRFFQGKIWYDMIRKLQSDAIIAIKGPDVRWCRNDIGILYLLTLRRQNC